MILVWKSFKSISHPAESHKRDLAHPPVLPEPDVPVAISPPEKTCSGYRNGSRERFTEIDKETFVFSAYLDHRSNDFDNMENNSLVRIMAVLRAFRKTKPEFKCTFNNDGFDLESDVVMYEMCESHGMHYLAYILSCVLPDGLKDQPCDVRLSRVGSSHRGEIVEILSLRDTRERRDFSICVPPLFGQIPADRLVEFVELSRFIGADHLTFYDFQTDERVKRVLNYYQDTGIVSIVPWDLPAVLEENMWYHGQMLSIQDCLYRNMYRTEFLAFNDIDEFIVPRQRAYWSEMVRDIYEETPDRCGMAFSSAIFGPGIPKPGQAKLGELFSMTNTQRSPKIFKLRAKCMVKPHFVFEQGIHHVSKPITADLVTALVPSEIAFVHHYRGCDKQIPFQMKGMCDLVEPDDYLLRFGNRLLDSHMYVMDKLFRS